LPPALAGKFRESQKQAARAGRHEGEQQTGTAQAVGAVLGRVDDRRRAARSPEEIEASRRQGLVASLALELGARYSPDRARLDTYQLYHSAQEEVLRRVQAFAADWPARRLLGAGMVLYGPCGTGKDHLLAALLHAAAGQHGLASRWVNGQELYGQFRDRMDSGQREEDLLRPLAEAEVLGVSDPIPPIGEPTAWNRQQLYRLLDRRYKAMRPTLVTLNAQSVDDAALKLSVPCFDRLRESAEIVACYWPSFRQRAQLRAV
jgi:DNA replication protein DnaC